jgi:hypothetical protein
MLDVELGPRHHGRVVNVVTTVAEVDSSEHARSLLSRGRGPVPISPPTVEAMRGRPPGLANGVLPVRQGLVVDV